MVPDAVRNGIHHNYYKIDLPVDPRDFLAGLSKIELVEDGSNKLIVKAPAVPYHWLYEGKEQVEGEKLLKQFDKKESEYEAISRNYLLEDPNRQKMFFVLAFPSGTRLSAKHFPKARDPSIPKTTLAMQEGNVELNSALQYKTRFHYVRWRVTIVEDTVRRVNAIADTTEEAEDMGQLAAGMSHMNTGP